MGKREATSNATAAAEFATELCKMESECKASVKETDAKHQTELEALQQQQEEAVAELKASATETDAKHQTELEALQQQQEEAVAELKAAKEEMVSTHQAEIQEFQEVIE